MSSVPEITIELRDAGRILGEGCEAFGFAGDRHGTTVRLVALVEEIRPSVGAGAAIVPSPLSKPKPSAGSARARLRGGRAAFGRGGGRRGRSTQCLLDLLLRSRSGLRPAGRARGATERQRAGQDPEHQPGEAERRETHGQRPAEAVAGRTERSEQSTDAVRAQPLGVLRPELEVPRSLIAGSGCVAVARLMSSAWSVAHSVQVSTWAWARTASSPVASRSARAATASRSCRA